MFKTTNINLERPIQKSEFILTQLNDHLAERDWLELGHPTIADLAVFPYVALARDGKIDLNSHPNVLAWIDRIEHLPGFVGMNGIEVPIAA